MRRVGAGVRNVCKEVQLILCAVEAAKDGLRVLVIARDEQHAQRLRLAFARAQADSVTVITARDVQRESACAITINLTGPM